MAFLWCLAVKINNENSEKIVIRPLCPFFAENPKLSKPLRGFV